MAHSLGSGQFRYAVTASATEQWLLLGRVLADAGRVPCQNGDAEAWWPVGNEGSQVRTRMAVEACRRCPARQPCLEYALAADERFGIWAGTLPDERRAMRRTA